MLLTVGDFRARIHRDLSLLIRELQDQTGRRGEEEATAWANSLPAVSRAFSDPIFQPLHLYFGGRGHVSLEYRLPASSSWCDIVLLGAHAGQPSAAILELKHWDTWADRPGQVEGLIEHHGETKLHPSEQVRGYVEYCQNFHSTVMEMNAAVHGCVLFTKDDRFNGYGHPPNDGLVRDFPCFAVTAQSGEGRIVDYFGSRLSEPNTNFAEKFEAGYYDQDRSFVSGIAGIISRSTKKGLVLLDNQRYGFALCRAEIEKALFGKDAGKGKKVLIIEGPPGSGKSVIAAKVWADLASDSRFPRGRFVVTTTSTAQETNWKHLLQLVAGHHGAEGIVLPANKYAPEQLQRLKWWKEQRPGKLRSPAMWRNNLVTLKAEHGGFWMPDDHLDVSVVDEAHALINPEVPRAITHSGWPNPLGPQAYHIIRASRVSIYFLDPEQRFRERESTTVDDIKRWAIELGADVLPTISLAGGQFRCAGSKEYVDWVEALLAARPQEECVALAAQWTPLSSVTSQSLKTAEESPSYTAAVASVMRPRRGTVDFRICDTPFDLESMLRDRIATGETARIIAPFARPWITVGNSAPHGLLPDQQDFCIQVQNASGSRIWSRSWNVIRNWDYSAFVQAAPGSRISHDPLAEVGCTYAVRGFDFDYVGVLWLEDLRWSGERWTVDLAHVNETGISKLLKAAKKKKPDPTAHAEILGRVKQAYRILLTRAIKGVYVWFADPATRLHVSRMMDIGVAGHSMQQGTTICNK